jgi:hypothetical protein
MSTEVSSLSGLSIAELQFSQLAVILSSAPHWLIFLSPYSSATMFAAASLILIISASSLLFRA